jgi:hypothetical protein
LRRALGCAIAGAALTASSFAQSPRGSWYVSLFGGHSARILGSQDIRTNYGFGLSWQKDEPRFHWRNGPSQLVFEAYYEHSNGQEHPTGQVTDALGVIWYARFRFPSRRFNLFLDIGEGAQISTSESFDLGTRLNSSPMIGGGFAIRQGRQETLVGVRMLHLSNANAVPNNRGQNQLFFYVAVKF